MPASEILPQSVLSKITAPDSSLPFGTWSTLTNGATAAAAPPGYERVPVNDELPYLCYMSQGCDIRLIQPYDSSQFELRELSGDPGKFIQVPKSGELELWAPPEDIEHVKRYPVILTFSTNNINLGGWPPEVQAIQTLQFLPPPQLGEFGTVISDGRMHIHPLSNLPSEARQLQLRLHHALQTLASPSSWYPWTPFVGIAAGDPLAEAFNAHTWLLNQPGSTSDKDKYVVEQLEAAQKHIQQVQEAQAKSDWSAQWQEIQRMLKDLASAYWIHHQNQRKSPPEIANVFQNGISQVITGLPFQAYPYAAIAPKDAWEEVLSTQEYEVIIAHRRIKPSGITTTQVRGDATGKDREMVLADLRAQVKKLSDLHSDFYWAMVAQLVKGQKDEGGNAWISVQQLLDYRGIAPIMKKESGHERRAGHRQEDKFDASQIISSMENTWIKLDELEIVDSEEEKSKGKKRGRNRITRESRLFMFGDIIYHQELSMDGKPGRRYPIAWQYRASNWMLPFLEGPNRFTGVLLEKTLNYDPNNEFWEKRLAKYFMIYFRTNASKHNRPIKIQELFDECNLTVDERNPQRTRDRFEKAMNAMREDGHVRNWAYQKNEDLPARKWLTTWMGCQIIVEDPQIIEEQYRSIKTHAQVLRIQTHSQGQPTGKKSRRKKS